MVVATAQSLKILFHYALNVCITETVLLID